MSKQVKLQDENKEPVQYSVLLKRTMERGYPEWVLLDGIKLYPIEYFLSRKIAKIYARKRNWRVEEY
jgi:hypothetical protein